MNEELKKQLERIEAKLDQLLSKEDKDKVVYAARPIDPPPPDKPKG